MHLMIDPSGLIALITCSLCHNSQIKIITHDVSNQRLRVFDMCKERKFSIIKDSMIMIKKW